MPPKNQKGGKDPYGFLDHKGEKSNRENRNQESSVGRRITQLELKVDSLALGLKRIISLLEGMEGKPASKEVVKPESKSRGRSPKDPKVKEVIPSAGGAAAAPAVARRNDSQAKRGNSVEEPKDQRILTELRPLNTKEYDSLCKVAGELFQMSADVLAGKEKEGKLTEMAGIAAYQGLELGLLSQLPSLTPAEKGRLAPPSFATAKTYWKKGRRSLEKILLTPDLTSPPDEGWEFSKTFDWEKEGLPQVPGVGRTLRDLMLLARACALIKILRSGPAEPGQGNPEKEWEEYLQTLTKDHPNQFPLVQFLRWVGSTYERGYCPA
jgi:hypothetical protein